MNLWRLFLYIIAMAVTTYLVRMIPLTVFQKKITNRFFDRFFSMCHMLFWQPWSYRQCFQLQRVLDHPSQVLRQR